MFWSFELGRKAILQFPVALSINHTMVDSDSSFEEETSPNPVLRQPVVDLQQDSDSDADTESEDDSAVGSVCHGSVGHPSIGDPPNLPRLYIPDFIETYQQLHLSVEEEKAKLQSQNWLSESLVHEITSYFPQDTDIDRNDGNKRNPDAFSHKVGSMFPVGRIFASSKQLDQAAEMLLSNWGVKKVHNAKSIRCFFSLATTAAKEKHIDATKRREKGETLKNKYKCPFIIRYSFIGYTHNKDTRLPTIFYQVKITQVNLSHTCELSTNSHRVAIQKSGYQQPNLDGMNDIMSLLREKPTLSSETLRPLLLKYLPTYYSIDAKFIGNFRKRAQYHLIQHGDRELCMNDVQRLSSRKPLASDELLLSDDPMLQHNMGNILRKILSNDASTWHARSFLNDLKKNSGGFDYRIKEDNNGAPEGVCWITPEMRSDLLRYGSIVFLDAQKKQYNSLNWPYIGPCIKDCDMKVRVITECLICEESYEAYIWVLERMAEMEPRFHLSSIKLIFADEFISENILVDLGIQNTCTLRGDYHHLLNEVWVETFGKFLCSKMREYLKLMLMGTKHEWEFAYEECKLLLSEDAQKMSSLQEIYSNPKYFAGWYLRQMEENLNVNGSVPAEQNHSSISSHLGKGASWCIAEHIKNLIVRQRNLTTQRRTREAERVQTTNCYKSDRGDQKGIDDDSAIRCFSKWAYEKLYLVETRKIFHLAHEVREDGSTLVWPRRKGKESDDCVVVEAGQRCKCERRVAYNHQCCHELLLDGQLKIDRYSQRWLNINAFNQQHPSLTTDRTLKDLNRAIEGAQNDVPDNEGNNGGDHNNEEDNIVGNQEDADFDNEDSNEDGETTLAQLATTNNNGSKINYKLVCQKAVILVRLAQSSDPVLVQLHTLFDRVAHRMRLGQSIEAHFDLAINDESTPLITNPVQGTLRPIPNAGQQKRMRSRHEINRARSRPRLDNHRPDANRTTSVLPPSNDAVHAPVSRGSSSVTPNGGVRLAAYSARNNTNNDAVNVARAGSTNTRACSVCGEPKHQRGSCTKLLRFKTLQLSYGKSDSEEIRLKLSGDLQKPGRFKMEFRIDADKRSISKNIPTKSMTGIVIHRQLCLREDVTNSCLECTILGMGGEMNPLFTKYLFSIPSVAKYVTKSRTNIIINELADGILESGIESVGFPTQHQLSQQSATLSQQPQNVFMGHRGLSQQAPLLPPAAYAQPQGLSQQLPCIPPATYLPPQGILQQYYYLPPGMSQQVHRGINQAHDVDQWSQIMNMHPPGEGTDLTQEDGRI